VLSNFFFFIRARLLLACQVANISAFIGFKAVALSKIALALSIL
jgi:hypothetical protein